MWNRLDTSKKNGIAIGLMILVGYLAYQLSFKATIEAIWLNGELSKREVAGEMDGVSVQLRRKDTFYKKVLKGYELSAEDVQGKMWQAISGIAAEKGVEVGFGQVANSQILLDSVALKNGIFRQEFTIRGDYVGLVRLADSVNKTRGIGKISSLVITVPKDAGEERELVVKLGMVGIRR